ncbi:MAG: type 2 isopentenyl-diphosphate Delta-isomerase [Solirubrobacterales bacterium]
MERKTRKHDHIRLAMELSNHGKTAGFDDITMIPNAIPEAGIDSVDLRLVFCGKSLQAPLLINAMTGGTDESVPINRALAAAAARYGIGIAVGSQTIALRDSELRESFMVVRDENPDGLVLANVGAMTAPEAALRAVQMIEADGLQLHLNTAQELAMPEGDRQFDGMMENIHRITEAVSVPVIVKEVGCGLARESVQKLFDAGVRIVDIGGRGGTSFVAIERARKGNLAADFESWGVPTAISLAETVSLNLALEIVASGGITSGLAAAKALAMGARIAGVAGHFLRVLLDDGPDELDQELQRFLYNLKAAAVLTGSQNLTQLQRVPMVIGGSTALWLLMRGIDPGQWSCRSV